MNYLFYFLLAGSLVALFVPVVKIFAFKFGVIDLPNQLRKIHKKPTALLGGFAVLISFFVALCIYVFFGNPNLEAVPLKFFYAICCAGIILVIGGFFDDKYNLPAKFTWIFPALATAIVVFSGVGVGIKFITNPLGGVISIDQLIYGVPLSGILVFIWLMGMTYTTKILDGMDGLVSGVGLIGALTLFFLSLTDKVNQPTTATLAIVLAGTLVGFLIYNFHPASIFLGEGGSTLVGFLLGVFAVISGAKIATTLLVMGIPILDVAWAIVRRVYMGSSPFVADRRHLHFRLLDIGLNQRQAVAVLWAVSAIFGFTAVFLQSMGKLVALAIVVFVMVGLVMVTIIGYKKQLRALTK